MISKWLDFSTDNVLIDYNIYNLCEQNTDLTSSLILQAKSIYNDFKNPVVFVSGGIDSQTMAYGFIKANIPVRFVNFKFLFNDMFCFSEQFYVKQFFEKNNTSYETIEVIHNKQSILSLFEKYDHFNTSRGFGILQILDSYLTFMKNNKNSTIITGSGIFAFERKNNICYGNIPHYNKGVTTSLLDNNIISFYNYAPYIYKYYEYVHKKNIWLQYPVNFEPKNLAYTELGFEFRPKLAGWEHFSNKDYSELTTIDYGIGPDPVLDSNDSSHKSTMRSVGFSENEITIIMKKRPNTNKYFNLYKFMSNINSKRDII